MLATAADELHSRGREPDTDGLLAHLDLGQPQDRAAWLEALSWRWDRQPGHAVQQVALVTDRVGLQYSESGL
jgi:hypothetical protein